MTPHYTTTRTRIVYYSKKSDTFTCRRQDQEHYCNITGKFLLVHNVPCYHTKQLQELSIQYIVLGAIVLSSSDAASQEAVVGLAQRVVVARARAPRDSALYYYACWFVILKKVIHSHVDDRIKNITVIFQVNSYWYITFHVIIRTNYKNYQYTV